MARKDKTIKFACNIETALMITDNLTQILIRTIEKWSQCKPLEKPAGQHRKAESDSSGKALEENIALALPTLFTGPYGKYTVSMKTMKYNITTNVEHTRIPSAIQIPMCIQAARQDCRNARQTHNIKNIKPQ